MTATAVGVDPIEHVALLADPLRRQIVVLLADEQLCTCHLVEALGASQPTVSYHLKALREAGWVRGEQAGRYTYYELQPAGLAALADALGALARRAAGPARRRPA
ncbi:MAG: metalloregulator ArsR/SmtB family transcription factor, partial [Nitriliruptoraceae bacterium]